jgi:TonB-linked SusC/RagA family outer membrane protein
MHLNPLCKAMPQACQFHNQKAHPVSSSGFFPIDPVLKKRIIMRIKLVSCIVFFALLHASAKTFSQISLHETNAPLSKVLKDIEKQSHYTFLYQSNDIDPVKDVSVDVTNSTLEQVLAVCLKDLPLDYKVEDQMVLIKHKDLNVPPVQPVSNASVSPIDITGRVTNKAGEALSGATVLKKRTKSGTITGANGSFVLRDVLPADTLIVSFIGYQPLFVKVGNKTVFNLVLQEATNDLDQVVIEAYGQTSQRLNTGDITTVSGETINKQPVMNPLLALEGQVPGLSVTQTSGYGSAPVAVELRGRSSIGGFPSDPLYVIDGVPLTVVDVSGTSGYPVSSGFLQNGLTGPASGQSPIFSINANDIESISVLKDADATSIYGSRGSNGVILITTKKGAAGKTKLDVSLQTGESQITSIPQLMDIPQYIAMREEALKNDGITPTVSNAYDILDWGNNPYTNWEKKLYGGIGGLTSLQTGLSGGDALTTFRIGAGYTRQTYPSTITGADSKGSLSFNLSHKSNNQKFVLSFSSEFSLEEINYTNMSGSQFLPPDAPGVYDAEGNLNYNGWDPVRYRFPFANLETPYSAQTDFVNSNLTLSYEAFKGLSIKNLIGFNYAQTDQTDITPISSQDPEQDPTGTAEFGNNNNKGLLIEPQITYDRTISKGKLSVLLASSIQHILTDGTLLSGNGYTSDFLIRTISDAPTVYAYDNYGEYKYASLFGRLNYNWEDKYLVDFTARRDGSSRFGPDHEFGNFGSAGLAYIFTEEQWFKNDFSFLSFGKLRTNYGTTGLDEDAGQYNYLSRYEASGTIPYDGITILKPTQFADPNLHWEVDKELEFALDLGFLKDRILLTATYYRRRIGDQLVNYPTPAFTGFTSVVANLPALVQNQGEEFYLKAKLINGKSFNWSFNFNISFNKNKLVSFPNLQLSPYANSYVIGQPLNITRLLHYTGIDPLTGQYTYEDKNHDGVISDNPGPTDDRFIYNLNPKFFGGFGTDLNYHEFHLSAFFTYVEQMGFNLLSQGNTAGRALNNQPVSIIGNEWQFPGDIASVARFTTQSQQSDQYFEESNAGYTNASYIRLKNLHLSYDLPKSFANKIGMENCAIVLTGQNLFVITPFKGIDPTVQYLGQLPPAKVITLGLNLNF